MTVFITDPKLLATVTAALVVARSKPAATVRDFETMEKRAADPNDKASKLLNERLPGLRASYEEAVEKITRIDQTAASLTCGMVVSMVNECGDPLVYVIPTNDRTFALQEAWRTYRDLWYRDGEMPEEWAKACIVAVQAPRPILDTAPGDDA